MPRQVVVTFSAFEEIVEFTSKFSSNKIPREKWMESMGFLWCKAEGDRYIVQDAVGMASGDELSVAVPPGQLGGIEKQQEERPDLYLGGWFHTHPGLSLFFSETDVQNQLWYQQGNDDGLGIVFDHTMVDVDFIGFKIFRLDSRDSFDYHEVPYSLEGFTAEGLAGVFARIGIGERVTRQLAAHLGLEGGEEYEEILPEVVVPASSDPAGDIEALNSRVEDALEAGNAGDALKYALQSREIANSTEDEELKADATLSLVDACVGAGLPQTAWDLATDLDYKREDGKLPYPSYYAGKLAAARARILQGEGNLAGALESWKAAAGFLLENENYDEAYRAAREAARIYEEIGEKQLYSGQLAHALEIVKAALEDPDEDPDDWTGERDELEREIDKVVKEVRTRGIQRV
ncbi:MAG: hypothetical protein ACTSU5_16135 [Promethearchaeota archaeon]